jgi:hypothetical protein
MTRQATLAGLQLLLEYARDELDVLELHAAASHADEAMAIVRAELDPSHAADAPSRGGPLPKPRLVFTRRTADRSHGNRR